MAETVTLVWIRGPGFGCRAVRAASGPCSVRDFIHQHCQDQLHLSLSPIPRMAEWVKQQAEREAEKEQKRLERLQRKLAEPRHCFTSPDYQQQCHEMAERLEDSVLRGMQAASSKMVSAEIGETRKRPNKSKPDEGTSAAKRKCFWLGMEGLETVEESSSESSDDDSEDAPSTSGMSFHVPKSDSDGVDVAAEFPSSSQRAPGLSTDCSSSEKPQTPVTGSGNGVSEDSCTELGATSPHVYVERKTATETEKTQERKEAFCAEKGARFTYFFCFLFSQDIGQESVDLLAFNSVAEVELLGLEKLKCELTARGLKCGGTLQERAARLFSVRGLAKAQIDPALFARPLKGKKK
ncbi:PREDICTED: protein SDE2 homolog [Hipposideros armiger]|uniref:Replication stress response regulator SDE2 n=1 Tax=Hipposideros armiger TaxID=186990 RepID=A0A8B7SPD2_HIPAR|nr:PREDICTED: protein SDE2 homolog [Hipposideros armiger]